MNNVIERILQGEIRAAARLMRDIDDGIPSSRETLKALYPHTGKAYIIGISGFPGVGKSTLVDQMIEAYRAEGKTLGVLAVDPTSPFSGGAILGDRVRMQRHGTDPGVFIRSIATRGYFGGLSRSTHSIIDVLDAMGKDIILVETVGVGQDEVDIVTTAHTTIITVIPGMGDDIQAIKAGILEVADIFVVNKADREGLKKTINELQAMLDMNTDHNRNKAWRVPVMATEAVRNVGIQELLEQIASHKDFLFDQGKDQLRKHQQTKALRELTDTIKETVIAGILKELEGSDILNAMIDDLVDKKTDPFTLCEKILETTLPKIRN